MRCAVRRICAASLIVGLAFVIRMPVLHAGEADAAVQKSFDKLLSAIKSSDRDAFVADATDAVKQGTTPAIMDVLRKQLGVRLEKGSKASYLCHLKQAGHQVHLWKMTFKDDGDDVVVRMVLKDGKLAGFFLQ